MENPLRRQRGDSSFHRARPNFYLHRRRQRRRTFANQERWRQPRRRSSLAEQKDEKPLRHLSILYENHLYGFDQAILKCLDAETGEEKWKTRGYAKGTLIVADGHLILLGEQGNLGIAQATPEGFVEKASYPAFDSRCWTAPSLANGRLYMRDESEIVCLDIRESVQ